MNRWIFQGNPDTLGIAPYLRDPAEITWTVRRKCFADQIQVGDQVFLWRAAGSSAARGAVSAVVITIVAE